MYARVTTMFADEVRAAIGTADVVVINWGLHYQKMTVYEQDLHAAFKVLDEYAQQPGKAVLFQASRHQPRHPPAAVGRGAVRRASVAAARPLIPAHLPDREAPVSQCEPLRLGTTRRALPTGDGGAAFQVERPARVRHRRVGEPRL